MFFVKGSYMVSNRLYHPTKSLLKVLIKAELTQEVQRLVDFLNPPLLDNICMY